MLGITISFFAIFIQFPFFSNGLRKQIIFFIDRVLHDSQVAGGTGLRKVDHWLSENLGGYRSVNSGARKEPSIYGKYVEPGLHAVEHLRRGVLNDNQAEYGRAKDVLGATGQGLHKKNTKYQESYQKRQPKKQRRK